ncbi:SE-domain-containing protein [Xylariaceae sp. FL0662B]|nr:SE-domain-containing protein [Xylariaceae sp. FL0662B]
MSTTTVAIDALAERRTKYHEADVVVVGAGVFGCAIAYALANQGRSVILLERWLKEPNRIVGELMQPGGVESLKKLGLEHCMDDIDAVPCLGYDVVYYGEDVLIPYPYVDEKGNISSEAPIGSAHHKTDSARPQGRAFHHGRFIMQLRRACLKHPNITVFETEALSTIKGDHNPEILGVETRTTNADTGEKQSDCFFGQLTIIADGYASKFRKQYLGEAPIVRSKFYALELIDCQLPHNGYGHVIIGAKTPVLLYQIGTHETRALIDVPDKLPEASPANGGVRGYMANVILPKLPPSVQPSFRAALEKDNKIPASMPNSWLPAAQQSTPGLLILGDALNMRHPLTGGGMTVALNDVVIMADLLAPARTPNLGDAAAVQRATAGFYRQRKQLTSIINVLAQALYSLFAAQDPQLSKLQRGCFEYFQRGFTAAPMGLLAGLLRRPGVLAGHFFSVAFLAVWLDWKATGLWKLPLLPWNAFWILWTASVVFLPVMWGELVAA